MELGIGSICTGIGGLDLGVQRYTGRRLMWAMESDAYCQRMIQKNFADVMIGSDAFSEHNIDLTYRHFLRESWPDVLTAGTPCQGFSVAGKKKGINDGRSNLAMRLPEIIDMVRPELFVWENVPGVTKMSSSVPYTSFLSWLERQIEAYGYFVKHTVVSASEVGMPHLRRRVFLAALYKPTATSWCQHNFWKTTQTEPLVKPNTFSLLPTPTASMGSRPGRYGRRGGPNIQTAIAEGWWESRHDALEWWADVSGTNIPECDGRLTPEMAEWMMGLPQEWTGEHRGPRLRAIGNAAAPRQAEQALRTTIKTIAEREHILWP